MNKVTGPTGRLCVRDTRLRPSRRIDTVSCGGRRVCAEERRSFLQGIALVSLGLLTGDATGVFAASDAGAGGLAVGDPSYPGRPREGDRLAPGDATGPVKALGIDDIPNDRSPSPLLAFPLDAKTSKVRNDDRFNGIILLKFKEAELVGEMKAVAAAGVLAYSAVCVHQGCDISTYQPAQETYYCFCHFSRYYPLQDGAVAAGPAPRALPNLPLKLASDGRTLVVAGPFNAPIGPGYQ